MVKNLKENFLKKMTGCLLGNTLERPRKGKHINVLTSSINSITNAPN